MKSYRMQGMALMGQGAAVVLLYFVFFFAGRIIPTGGVDWAHSRLIWISCAVPTILIAWAHYAVAKQLLNYRRD